MIDPDEINSDDNRAFLRAIAATPEDDLTKLVYADWLEERGVEELAEMIRLKCEPNPSRPDVARLDTLRKVYTNYLTLKMRGQDIRMQIHEPPNGLITRVCMLLDEFLVRGEDMLSMLPTIRRVRFLTGHPHSGDSEVERLAKCPALRHVKELDLHSYRIGHDGAAALAASPFVSSLESLDLTMNRIEDDGIDCIASAPALCHLRRLVLHANRIGDAGAVAIARSPAMGELRALHLACNRIGDAGVTALAGSENMRNLTQLTLLDNEISESGVGAVANSCVFRAEMHLNISSVGYEFHGSFGDFQRWWQNPNRCRVVHPAWIEQHGRK